MTKVYKEALKAKSQDFFVLPAGLDLATDGFRGTMTPEDFYRRIHASDPNYFKRFDGWTTHGLS